MANPKGNPKISEYGKNTRFNGCSSVDALEKRAESYEAKGVMTTAFRRAVTQDVADDIVRAQISKARHGNGDAAKLIIEMLGEKPKDQVEVTGSVNNPFDGLTTEELRRLIDD